MRLDRLPPDRSDGVGVNSTGKVKRLPEKKRYLPASKVTKSFREPVAPQPVDPYVFWR